MVYPWVIYVYNIIYGVPVGELTGIPHPSSRDGISAGASAGQPKNPRRTPMSITIYDYSNSTLNLIESGGGLTTVPLASCFHQHAVMGVDHCIFNKHELLASVFAPQIIWR